MAEDCDVAIIGGGIIGTSLLYTLSKFTDITKIILFEKNAKLAQESTSSRSNAQTLHIGDIETNYSIEKAMETKLSSELIPKYTSTLPDYERDQIIRQVPKMVLGVGDSEVELIEKRYSGQLMSVFPSMVKLDRKGIANVEPYVVKGRDPSEKIIAAYSESGNMVAFDKLAESFAHNSMYNANNVKICTDEYVKDVRRDPEGYKVITSKTSYKTRFVVLAAGGYSLYFAKSMGYGEDLSLLSIGGNFYHSRKVLNGKVYCVQKGGVPFAAVHGDPDIGYPDRTRFGPTVSMLPYLENAKDITTESHMQAFEDYVRALGPDKDTIESLLKIISDKDIVSILLSNIGYLLPDAGKYMFVRDKVNKIVPTLKNADVQFDKEAGGVRPQIIDKKQKRLVLGVVELKQDGLIFEMAPSPGASACLKGALEDAIEITNYLGMKFKTEEFCKIFAQDEPTRTALFNSLRAKPK